MNPSKQSLGKQARKVVLAILLPVLLTPLLFLSGCSNDGSVTLRIIDLSSREAIVELENSTGYTVSHGSEYVLEKEENGSWVLIPLKQYDVYSEDGEVIGSRTTIWPAVLLSVGPGESSVTTIAFQGVFDELSPGHYRVAYKSMYLSTEDGTFVEDIVVYAEFDL